MVRNSDLGARAIIDVVDGSRHSRKWRRPVRRAKAPGPVEGREASRKMEVGQLRRAEAGNR